MEIREFSFYSEFKCLAEKCSQTCCKGWLIPLTEEDTDRFAGEKGLLGFRLFLSSSGRDPVCLNSLSLTCPFYTLQGLCSLQLKKGHDFIPEVCRDYPRFYRNYGPFEERLIDLSCIHGAGLFIDHLNDLFFHLSKGEPESRICTTNDDADFLSFLLDSRDELIEGLNNTGSFEDLSGLISKISSYSAFLERESLKGMVLSRELHSFRAFETDEDKECFPLPYNRLRRLISECLYVHNLRLTNPFLYKECLLFFKYDKKIRKKAMSFQKLFNDHKEKYPKDLRLFSSYYIYYLCEYYLRSYEDYSFVKNTSLGVIHLNLILLFFILESKEKGALSKEDKALIISSYNKKAYNNDSILNKMYSVYME